MAFLDELSRDIASIFPDVWKRRDGTTVPEAEDLRLTNDGVSLDATVLYADLADSTGLVSNHHDWFAAEVIKAFLMGAVRVIGNLGGTITAYDGDRVMAIWIGEFKNSNAAKAALQIHWVTKNVVTVKAKEYYGSRVPDDFAVRHAVGIDASKVLAARTGVRGANDIVWVGRAANLAAKMSSIRDRHSTFITSEVYNQLNKASKLATDGTDMWEQYLWRDQDLTIFASTYWWEP